MCSCPGGCVVYGDVLGEFAGYEEDALVTGEVLLDCEGRCEADDAGSAICLGIR